MKTGLALSGGGVLGVAHIGLLTQLEKHKINIDLIAGTSSGAIVGSLFAVGGVALIEKFLADLDQQGLFSRRQLILQPLPHLIFEKVRSTLKKYLPEKFADLPIPFIAVATNFSDGQPVFLESGNLVDSIMASAAVPGAFSSQEINGHSLVDGGITRNLPAGILREKGMQFVIGSSLFNIEKLPKYDTPKINPNRIDTMVRSIEIMQKELAEYEAKKCDFLFAPPVETFYWFNFDKMPLIKQIGQDYAGERSPELVKVYRSSLKKKKPFWRKIFS